MFDKIFFVDTNIILDDAYNVIKLSEKGKNLIIICKTVLDELDSKKKGDNFENYQAREFNRILIDTVVEKVYERFVLVSIDGVKILLTDDDVPHDIGLVKYTNDEKIISTAKNLEKKLPFEHNEYVIVSNDIGFRTRCILRQITNVVPLESTAYDPNIEFSKSFYIDDKVFPDKDFYQVKEVEEFTENVLDTRISHVEIIDNTGHPYYLFRSEANLFQKIDNRAPEKFMSISMRNMEQRVAFNIGISDTDIVVLEGIAGTGKTLLALLSALYLKEKSKPRIYDKIIYLRKTIISGDRQDEIGFLPGSKLSKIAGYLYPIKDNIEYIVKKKSRKKKWTSEELDAAVRDFENQFNIEYEYVGHLRGRSLNDCIIILDESQNFSIKDLTTILSRIGENSKVFVLGSIKQIDNPFLNKYNNALTFMLNQCGYFNSVRIQGIRLESVHRGKITEWIEKVTK